LIQDSIKRFGDFVTLVIEGVAAAAKLAKILADMCKRSCAILENRSLIQGKILGLGIENFIQTFDWPEGANASPD
jgi:translation initiation factor 1 (eIF-1/SUI1)